MPSARQVLVGFAVGPAAAAFLDGMPAGKLRRQVAKKMMGLAKEPYPQGCKKLNGIKLGKDAVWRVRSGDYRILYVIRSSEEQSNPGPHTEIIVIDIDDRKDVYR